MTLRQIERQYIELQYQIAENGGVECAQVPDVFFPEDESDREQKQFMIQVAKSICEDCPVKLPCNAYAKAAHMVGVWGGTTYEERQSSS